MTVIYSEFAKHEENPHFEISAVQRILENSLNKTHQKPTPTSCPFPETVNRLKAACRYDKEDGGYWSQLIQVTPNKANHVRLVITDSSCTSTTLATNPKEPCHYFKLFSLSDPDSPFLTIRTDLTGTVNELTTVASSPPYMGNQVQEIADNFMSSIGIKTTYVHDASFLWVGLPSEEKIRLAKISLRRLTAIATDSATSFYEKIGFEMASFKNETSFDNLTISQDREFYFAAIEKVRTTKLKELHKLGLVAKSTLESFSLHYLGSKDFGEKSVHDLAKSLLEASKKATDRANSNHDLLLFQQKFLSDRCYTKAISKTRAIYNLATEIIRRHFILKKDYSSKTAAHTFLEYSKSPHKTLDELAQPVIGPKGAYWDDIVRANLLTTPAELEASQSFTATDEEVSLIFYDSPEEFFTSKNSPLSHNDGSDSKNISKSCWVTIPNRWKGDDNQKMTYLFLTVETGSNGKSHLTIRETIEEDAIAHSIDDQPLLARCENREIEVLKGGIRITPQKLKEFICELLQSKEMPDQND
jgi:hypothetical protein